MIVRDRILSVISCPMRIFDRRSHSATCFGYCTVMFCLSHAQHCTCHAAFYYCARKFRYVHSDDCSDGVRRVEEVLAVMEEVVLGDEFGSLQLDFCKRNCHHFEEGEENKLIYMDLFSSYTTLLEDVIERELKTRIADFDMEGFLTLLMSEYSTSELENNEIFELLLTLADFEHFKDFMLGCKTASDASDLGVDFSLRGHAHVAMHDTDAVGGLDTGSEVMDLKLM